MTTATTPSTPTPASAGRVPPSPRTAADTALTAVRRHPLLLVLAVMVLVFQLTTSSFLDAGNLRGIATDAATLAIVAVPLALLVISGYLDLSVGSTLALGGLVAAGSPASSTSSRSSPCSARWRRGLRSAP